MDHIQTLHELLAMLNEYGADLRHPIDLDSLPPEGRPAAAALGQFMARVADAFATLDQSLGQMGTKEALQVLQLRRLTGILDSQNQDLQGLTRTIEELAQGVTQVAADAHDTAAAADQMAVVGEQSIATLTGILQAVGGLAGEAKESRVAVDSLVTASQSVGEHLRSIQGIAQTSQLLALNAAIQAAHANDRAFAVVAQEMRALSTRTADLVKRIETELKKMTEAAIGARQAMGQMSAKAEQAEREASEATTGLQSMGALLQTVSAASQSIAAVTEEQAAATETMTEGALLLSRRVEQAAASLDLTRNVTVSDLVEEAHQALGQFRIGSRTDQMRSLVAQMAMESEIAVERLLQSGALPEQDLWDTDYREIKGAEIRRLSRLFDVSRVPASGFDPAKYYTRYDEKIDLPLNAIMDRAAVEADLVFATVLDLNGFCIAQPRKVTQDWTGIPEKDLMGNRVKRLVTDPVSRKAYRVALPAHLQGKAQIMATDLAGITAETGERPFLLQTYALDTGVVVLALAMPLYVRGRRWGTVRIGYRTE
ncbi:MAG TPA: methyl-accepting chemotaxis protein [Symbiobacteriaceae bacterium]|nr:methyl-accepting chemotaxis protein [Symbiobacteriaceae bacterium]